MNSKTAMRASIWVRKWRRSSSSHSSVAKKLSHIALSKQSPTEPIEGRTPASRQRIPKAIEVYCVPLINDNQICRLTTIRIAGCRRPDGAREKWSQAVRLHGERCAGRGVAEKADGRQNAGSVRGGSRDERAECAQVGARVVSVTAEQAA